MLFQDQHIDPDINYYGVNNSAVMSYYTIDQFNSLAGDWRTSLYILNQNIRSINANFESFVELVAALEVVPDIIVLTETWLGEHGGNFGMPYGFTAHHTIRAGRRGGGVTVLCSDKLKAKRMSDLCTADDTIESCIVEIVGIEFSLVILAIYRPHSDSIINFNNRLIDLLNHHSLRNKNVVIVGDLNIDLLLERNHEFICSLQSLHFVSIIDKPTRFPGLGKSLSATAPSLLDHIWINFDWPHVGGIIYSDITDHSLTFLIVERKTNLSNVLVEKSWRCSGPSSVAALNTALSGVDWPVRWSGDLESKVSYFIDNLNKMYCECFPLVKKSVSPKRLSKPWLSAELFRLIKQKSLFYKLCKRNLVSAEYYRTIKNKIDSTIRRARRSYYSRSFLNGDAANSWRIIREALTGGRSRGGIVGLTIDGSEVSDNFGMAEEFNSYFTNIAQILKDEIPPTNVSPYHYISDSLPRSLFLKPVTPGECGKMIANLKDSCCGIDAMPTMVLKKVKHLLSYPICLLINESFSVSKFPDILKRASVTPIHKADSPLLVSNYRPISVLHWLSKLFEKAIAARLTDFAIESSLFSKNQFGFRSGLSTVDAITQLTEFI